MGCLAAILLSNSEATVSNLGKPCLTLSTKGNTKQTQGKPRNNPETTLTTGLQPGQLDKPGQHAGKQPVKPHPQRNRVESPKKPGGNRVETLLLDAWTGSCGAPNVFANQDTAFADDGTHATLGSVIACEQTHPRE